MCEKLLCFIKVNAPSVKDTPHNKSFWLQLENYFWYFWRMIRNEESPRDFLSFVLAVFVGLKYKTGLPYFGSGG